LQTGGYGAPPYKTIFLTRHGFPTVRPTATAFSPARAQM
jgi:hypothetical protein